MSEVASGLTSPWGLIALADGSTLVSERDTRRILHLAGGRARMLRTIDDARPAGEGGLLGLAATQDQQTVFAYYTAENDNRIVSMSWNGQRLGEPSVILVAFPRVAGTTADGWPSVPMATSTSARARPGTPASRRTRSLSAARSSESPRGEACPGNPFGNEVYSYGHRNVQGLAFDDGGGYGPASWATRPGMSST